MAPVDPAKAVAAGTTQKPLLGLTAHASSEPSPALRRPRVARAAPSMIHMPAARASGPHQLARRGQPPGGDQRERGGRDQDLHPQDHRPDALDPRPSLRRTPAQEPAHHEADQAEHTPIVPCRRPAPGPGNARGGRR